MIRALLLLLAMMAPAAAQLRDFSCVGAERLEGDAVSLDFQRGADRLTPEAIAVLAPLAESGKAAPERNFCVLGFAASPEGGAQTASRLAARRARAVALQLSQLGIERDRVRAEARTRGFSTPREGRGVDRRAGARIILLPLS
ncbi:OmpA family protein [Sediminicoccus sp. KRV36]|uniref:OmpA family protein n=1 Tax=Sediminicoccus sp. KRV36 TaxID=3133721 RepID=UPI00200E0BAF|nr:OmpA family protein [Sediminicoccus rosea]UPY37450.1 OmpA family protein [Sediminicoccus rosea]